MEHYAATAIILAGGNSTRMGKDKALLEFQGKTFIAHLVEALQPRFKQVIISGNNEKAYGQLGVPVVKDKVVNAGPLAGLAAALEISDSDLNFIVSCDSPMIVFQVVNRMLKDMDDYDCAVVMGDDSQLEPLFGVYRKGLLPRIEAQLQSQNRSMHAFLSQCNLRTISVRKGTLLNINTPEDYENLLKSRDKL